MRIFIMASVAYVMGFLSAIPIGGVQIEVAKRSLGNHLRSAYMVILGSTVSDVAYGFIALFGLMPILNNSIFRAVFELASGTALFMLAFLSFKKIYQPHITPLEVLVLRSKRVGFITGLLLALTNPVMIVWWLVIAKIARDMHLVTIFTVKNSIPFIFFGGFGLASYLVILALLLHWAKKFVSRLFIIRINIALGFLLAGLAVYFIYTGFYGLIHPTALPIVNINP
jgi:threonine/homoserine/homoserine lactone efflux protein